MSDSGSRKVIIAGGGCAALEAAFVLQRKAGERVETTILAPDQHFATQALAVLMPFAAGRTPHEPLARLASDAGARLRPGRLAAVDAGEHMIFTHDGDALPYDALLIAVGAVKHAPFPHALVFGSPGSEERMHGLVQDLEGGYVRRIAFVVPGGASWPMPLYELALMAAQRAYDMCEPCRLTLVTAEDAPLGLFGAAASREVAERLALAGIDVLSGVHVDVPRRGRLELHPGGKDLAVDRIVTLPTLEGPAVDGLPSDALGFLPVDRHGRVDGVPDVYAAGDATDFPVKQGGLACRQADAAAEAIAAQAGVELEPEPFTAMLEGLLITERDTTFLRRDAGGAAGDQSVATAGPLWWPPTKIAGRELARHIAASPRARVPSDIEGIEVVVPVGGV